MAKKKRKKRGRPSKKEKEVAIDEKYSKAKESKEAKERRLQDELGKHASDSKTFLAALRDEWDDKEAMLVCKLEDEITTEGDVHSRVFDPRLSTIVFERSSRVMARNPIGKTYALSKNDIGKSKLMNLLLRYYQKNANYWHSMIVKCRIMDLYSLVYGTTFALVPWVVDSTRDYMGPELIPLPIRACYPQPSATSISESDWFQVSSMKSLDWLKEQKNRSEKWKNVDKLISRVVGSSGSGSGDMKPDIQQTYVEQEWYGTTSYADTAFPKVELRTEYRRNRWITFAPGHENMIVRNIENPYGNGLLPIVAKHAWPLMDSIIGLGEFERGKTLQYAVNSLINLYLDSVKYSLFPPIHINPKNVIDTTIKWGPGEKWLMKNPMVDVQQMRLSPRGLDTFQSTYQFLVGALMNQAGTTEVSHSASTSPALGKTPQAIRMLASRESARDAWDRTMMEDTLKNVYRRWIQMIVKKMENKVTMRIFGQEAKEISKDHPDIMEFFDKKRGYGLAKIKKSDIEARYDFDLETGSTMKPDLEGEQQNVSAILQMVLKNPAIIEAIRAKKKDLDIAELFKRWLIAGGVKDYEKIIIDSPELSEEDKPQDGEAMIKEAVSRLGGGGARPPMMGGVAPVGPQPSGAPVSPMVGAPPMVTPPRPMAPTGPQPTVASVAGSPSPRPAVPTATSAVSEDTANAMAALRATIEELRTIPTTRR